MKVFIFYTYNFWHINRTNIQTILRILGVIIYALYKEVWRHSSQSRVAWHVIRKIPVESSFWYLHSTKARIYRVDHECAYSLQSPIVIPT